MPDKDQGANMTALAAAIEKLAAAHSAPRQMQLQMDKMGNIIGGTSAPQLPTQP